MSPHWGVRALLREGVSRSGKEEGLRKTWKGCCTQRDGRVQGPQGDVQGIQDKEAGEQSRVRMRGVRAETEQEDPGVTLVRRGGEG